MTAQRVVVVRDFGALTAGDVDGIVRYLADPLDTTVARVRRRRRHDAARADQEAQGDQGATERAPESEKTDDVLVARRARGRRRCSTPTRRALIATHLGDDAGRVAALVDVLAAAFGPACDLGVDDVAPVPRRSRLGAVVPAHQRDRGGRRRRRARDPPPAAHGDERAAAEADAPAPGAWACSTATTGASCGSTTRRSARPTDADAALGGKVKEYPARKALDQARGARHRRDPPGVRRAAPGRPRPQGRARHPGGRGDGGARRPARRPLARERPSTSVCEPTTSTYQRGPGSARCRRLAGPPSDATGAGSGFRGSGTWPIERTRRCGIDAARTEPRRAPSCVDGGARQRRVWSRGTP